MDQHTSTIAVRYPFLAGDGEAARLMRATDWAATPVGPIDGWPAALRSLVGTLLGSRHAMFLWWGPELVQFYNDAYIPSFGVGKHPAAMGQRGRDCWPEIWPIIGPQIEAVMARGESTWHEDQLVPIFRNGRLEDVYWTYGYSPARLEDGRVGGVLVVTTETTTRMVAARQQAALQRVAAALARLPRRAPDLFADALSTLRHAAQDAPGLALMRWDEESGAAPQVLACMVAGDVLAAHDGSAAEGLAQRLGGDRASLHALARGDTVHLSGVLALPSTVHAERVTDAMLLPLRQTGHEAAGLSFLAVGLNPRLPMSARYRSFLQQLADALSNAIGHGESARERDRVDEEHESLIRQAPIGIAKLMGPAHTFTAANPLYCQLVGRSEEALVGKDYLVAFPELIGTPLPGILDGVYETGERYVSPEMLIPLNLGRGVLEDHFYEFNLEPMFDLRGRVIGLMAAAMNVTARVQARASTERAHAERQQLLERAQDAARAKDQFLAMLGHELRNPLAPIVSALHVMERKGAGAERERAVIERQVKHMTRLVDDLLDVSRIARGRIRLEPTLTRAAVMLTRAAEMVQPLMDQRGHRLEVSLPPTPILWWGDSARLVQVVTNLLTNAARYTLPGGQVRLSGRREGQELVIEVADNGVGIAPELLPGVFDVFYQGQQGVDRSQGGLGLGLALVKSLVAMHEGRVEAHSAGRDQGSRFVVRLPLREQPVVAEHDWPSGETAARQSQRVLMVDDNHDAVDLLAEALALHGHELRVAYTPEQALGVVEQFQPQVAVLDVGLPQMDGHELARRLRARVGEGCVLVALSGYGQDSDRERAQLAGFAHYLVKPVAPRELQALIARIAAGRAPEPR